MAGSTRFALAALGLLALCAGLWGCAGDFGSTTVSLGISGVALDRDGYYNLQDGFDYRLTWDVRSSSGSLLNRDFDDFTWGVSDSTVVRVNETSERVEARSRGTATISAITNSGGISDTIAVRVN